MKIAFLVLFTTLSNSFALPFSERSLRVVGGHDAPEGAYPYMVSIRDADHNHCCGASIIAPQWVVTAAHCVFQKQPSDFSIVVGSVSITSGGDDYEIASILVHEEYDDGFKHNDIALLQIRQSITYSTTVGPIELEEGDVEGVNCTLTGWGMLSYPNGVIPEHLQELEVMTISEDSCKAELPGYPIFEGTLCAVGGVGRGACQWDSGGPLQCQGKLSGIVSWGQPCATGKPDAYTKVSNYLPWIRQHTT